MNLCSYFIFYSYFCSVMLKKRYILAIFILFASLQIQAQKRSWIGRLLGTVRDFMDSATISGIDSNYIVAPKQPWQLMARYNMNQMDIMMDSHFGGPADISLTDLDISARIQTPVNHNVDLWVGYRGFGIGYSFETGPTNGSLFTISASGGVYSINLRLRNFKTNKVNAYINGTDEGDRYDHWHRDVELAKPIHVRSLIIDSYFMFNGERFSYCAAYDQSVMQIRSSGSFMVGAMWHDTKISYDSDENASFIQAMHDIGSINVMQGSLGAGYAYNWVPMRNMLVNVMCMPMVTIYNRQKMTFYDTNVDYDSESYDNDYIHERSSSMNNSGFMFMLNTRMSFTYYWKRTFFGVHGQWDRFPYDHGSGGSGSVTDWFVKAAFGVRF